MKKILIYDNNFYPELSSLAQLYTDLCLELSKEFQVNVICAVPSYTGKIDKKYLSKWIYKEEYEKIQIIRVKVCPFDKRKKISRAISILGYFFRAILATTKVKDVDIVIAVSQPPILGGILGVIGKRLKRCKLIYNIQDFNPEQIIATKYSKNRLLLAFMFMLDKYSCKCSDKIIVVGTDMVGTLVKRFEKDKQVPETIFVHNWVNEKKLTPLYDENVIKFKKKYGLMDKFVFMYSGNIGLIYDLENIIKVIEKITFNDVVFAFVGDGNVKGELISYAQKKNMNNVVFIPYQDNDKIIYSLNAADVHFVVNRKGMKGVACPSKLYGVMSVGKPVLGVLEEGTEARTVIENSQCGYVTEPEKYEEIEYLIKKMYGSKKDELEQMGINARKYLCDNLSRDSALKKYKNEILKT